MTTQNRKWLRRAGWTAAISLGSIVGLWLLYALIANVLIGTSLLEKAVTSDDEQVLLHYESAWSWLPGRVTVKGLSLRVQDSNIQFQLGIDRATLRIDLFSLARRTFSASHIEADGVTFHFRHKFLPMQVNERRAAAYPPIPGFSDPPLKARYIDPPLTDADYNLWTVELSDVNAATRDLWFMEWRFLGHASVTGAFRLKPVRALRIDPTVLRIQDGAFSIGGKDVLSAVTGSLETHVGTFDVRSRTGLDVLQQIDARIDLDGKVATIQPLGAMYGGDPSMKLARGEGGLAVHVAINAGRVAPQSLIEYRSTDVAAQLTQGLVHGDLRAVVRVLANRLVLGVYVTAVVLMRDDVELARVRAFAAGVDVNGTDLWRPFAVASGSVSVEKAAIAHLDAVQPLMPHGVVLHGGSAELSGQADVAPDAVTLHADATMHKAHVGMGKVDVTASGEARVSLKPNADQHGARGEASLAVQGVSVRMGEAQGDGLWLKARASGQFLPALDVSVTLSSGPEDALRRLALGNAFLPKVVLALFGGEPVRAKGRVRASKGRVSVVVASAKDAGIEASGTYRSVKGHGEQGDFLVHLGPINLAVTIRGADVSVKLVGEQAKPKSNGHKHAPTRGKR